MRKSKEEAEATRHKLLNAAEQLFFLKGISGTSLEQIAREAHMTRGAIYWHFKDKNDIIEALKQKFLPPEHDILQAALADDTGDVFEVFEATTRNFLRHFATDVSRQRIFKILDNQVPETSEQSEIACWALPIAQHARANGILTETLAVEEAAITISVVLNGLLSEWLATGRAFDLEAIGNGLVHRMLHSMRKI